MKLIQCNDIVVQKVTISFPGRYEEGGNYLNSKEEDRMTDFFDQCKESRCM